MAKQEGYQTEYSGCPAVSDLLTRGHWGQTTTRDKVQRSRDPQKETLMIGGECEVRMDHGSEFKSSLVSY